jgi:membrane associated rhomboid family serine protease
MYLPLHIDHPYEQPPAATIGLIAFLVFVFCMQTAMPESSWAAYMLWPDQFAPWQWWTSSLMHADVIHLGGNLLFLWCFGRYLEGRLGAGRYLLLWLVLAPVESLAYVATNLGGEYPALGASGVISGFMGVVLIASPGAQVRTLVVWMPYIRVIGIPAAFVLGIWVLEQIALGFLGSSGVAISAHLGGFAGGATLGWVLRQDRWRGTAWFLRPVATGRLDEQTRLWAAVDSFHRNRRDKPFDGKSGIPEATKPSWDKEQELPETQHPISRQGR